MALDAEVVVGLAAQFALSRTAFQNALGQRDARGDAVLDHLADGLVLPALDVGLLIRGTCSCEQQGHHRKKAEGRLTEEILEAHGTKEREPTR